jgi:hypothetical protein
MKRMRCVFYFSVLRVYLGRDGVGWVALGAVHCRRFVFSILGVGVDGVVVCLDGGRGCLGNGIVGMLADQSHLVDGGNQYVVYMPCQAQDSRFIISSLLYRTGR